MPDCDKMQFSRLRDEELSWDTYLADLTTAAEEAER